MILLFKDHKVIIVCQGTAKGVNDVNVHPVVCTDAKVTSTTMTSNVHLTVWKILLVPKVISHVGMLTVLNTCPERHFSTLHLGKSK